MQRVIPSFPFLHIIALSVHTSAGYGVEESREWVYKCLVNTSAKKLPLLEIPVSCRRTKNNAADWTVPHRVAFEIIRFLTTNWSALTVRLVHPETRILSAQIVFYMVPRGLALEAWIWLLWSSRESTELQPCTQSLIFVWWVNKNLLWRVGKKKIATVFCAIKLYAVSKHH